jgi:protoporphyrinogen oxidase
MAQLSRVAVLGSGISGLFCASRLRATSALHVDIFDMSTRGPGM